MATPALLALLVGAAGLGGAAVFMASRRMTGPAEEPAPEPVARTGRFARRDEPEVVPVARANGHPARRGDRRRGDARAAAQAAPGEPREGRAAREARQAGAGQAALEPHRGPGAGKPRRRPKRDAPPAEAPANGAVPHDELPAVPPPAKPRRRAERDAPPAGKPTNGAIPHDELPAVPPPAKPRRRRSAKADATDEPGAVGASEVAREDVPAADAAPVGDTRPRHRSPTTPDAPVADAAPAPPTSPTRAADDARRRASRASARRRRSDAREARARRARARRTRERPAQEPGEPEVAPEPEAAPERESQPPRRRRGAWKRTSTSRPPGARPRASASPGRRRADDAAPAAARRSRTSRSPRSRRGQAYPACRIKFHNRPIRTHFYAVPYEGGPVLARSPYFKLERGRGRAAARARPRRCARSSRS